MNTYAEVIDYIRSRIGPGKDFKDNAALAQHCDLSPVVVHRHIKGERGKGLKPFFQLLAGAGLEVRPVSDVACVEDISRYIAETASLKVQLEELRGQVVSLQAENLELSAEARTAEREAKEAYKKMLEVLEGRDGVGQAPERVTLEVGETFKVYSQKRKPKFLQEK